MAGKGGGIGPPPGYEDDPEPRRFHQLTPAQKAAGCLFDIAKLAREAIANLGPEKIWMVADDVGQMLLLASHAKGYMGSSVELKEPEDDGEPRHYTLLMLRNSLADIETMASAYPRVPPRNVVEPAPAPDYVANRLVVVYAKCVLLRRTLQHGRLTAPRGQLTKRAEQVLQQLEAGHHITYEKANWWRSSAPYEHQRITFKVIEQLEATGLARRGKAGDGKVELVLVPSR